MYFNEVELTRKDNTISGETKTKSFRWHLKYFFLLVQEEESLTKNF